MAIDFSAARQSYQKDELIENNAPNHPYTLLDEWIKQALNTIKEPYAMSLATCGVNLRPSVRTVLMREIVKADEGVHCVFYSNYDSSKGQDLSQNPFAEALFFWADLERQVRLSGRVEKLSDEQSARYFGLRPKESQLAAWVSSPQSGVVASRTVMEQSFDALKNQYQNQDIPKPQFWGGYRIICDKIEFWQGRANRMHDRLVYTHQYLQDNPKASHWQLQRLLP